LIVVWAACVKKKKTKNSIFFFWTSELHILQAFREHQARQIPTPYEPMAKKIMKTGIKLIFHVFSKELLHAAMWLKLSKG
jgi:hypothetical protein